MLAVRVQIHPRFVEHPHVGAGRGLLLQRVEGRLEREEVGEAAAASGCPHELLLHRWVLNQKIDAFRRRVVLEQELQLPALPPALAQRLVERSRRVIKPALRDVVLSEDRIPLMPGEPGVMEDAPHEQCGLLLEVLAVDSVRDRRRCGYLADERQALTRESLGELIGKTTGDELEGLSN